MKKLKIIFHIFFLFGIYYIIDFILYFFTLHIYIIPKYRVSKNTTEICIDFISILVTLLITFYLTKIKKLRLIIFEFPEKKKILFYFFLMLVYYLLNMITFILLEKNIFVLHDYSIPSIIGKIIVAPISEEFFYRGILLNYVITNFKISKFFNYISIVLISVLFSFEHQNNDFISFLYHFSFSFIMSLVYVREKNLTLVILLHILYNILIIANFIFI